MKGLLCLLLLGFFAVSAVVTAEDDIQTFSGGGVYSMTNGAPNYVVVSRLSSSGACHTLAVTQLEPMASAMYLAVAYLFPIRYSQGSVRVSE
mmetsp:Transcript_1725/g.3296  ORF Transcript_1725/g.3296 Transcript_1725/m.3296 type:complete len:92 (-) Transcript_1725:928-1203(-)